MTKLPLPPFRLERYFARHEFEAPYLLSSSDCAAVTVGDLLALEPDAAGALRSLPLGYTESRGAPALREAIAAGYPGLGADDVLVCAGAEEAIFLYMHAALEPGAEVVVQTPCYQSLATLPHGRGCTVVPWPLVADAYRPDIDDLERRLGPRTRLVVVNTPHNPTGAHLSRGAFDRLVALLRHRGIALFCDEVYRGLEADPGARLPPACTAFEGAASLGVVSKAYGLAGLRIGWIACRDRALLERMTALKDYTTICSSAPSELLATIALRHGDALLARCRAIVDANRRTFAAFLERSGGLLEGALPEAGPVAFPRLEAAADVDAFCDDLARRHGVMLLPGSVFDQPGHVRVGLGRTSFPEALARLGAALGLGAA